jgi:hypothetical protein
MGRLICYPTLPYPTDRPTDLTNQPPTQLATKPNNKLTYISFDPTIDYTFRVLSVKARPPKTKPTLTA